MIAVPCHGAQDLPSSASLEMLTIPTARSYFGSRACCTTAVSRVIIPARICTLNRPAFNACLTKNYNVCMSRCAPALWSQRSSRLAQGTSRTASSETRVLKRLLCKPPDKGRRGGESSATAQNGSRHVLAAGRLLELSKALCASELFLRDAIWGISHLAEKRHPTLPTLSSIAATCWLVSMCMTV